MYTDGFEREIKLRRELGELQKQVADLMDIQIRAEEYRDKVLREFAELEDENRALRRKLTQLFPD